MNPKTAECNLAEELLPDFWQDNLSGLERASDRAWLHSHLESCHACAGLAETWRQLEGLPQPAPSPLQRQRFQLMLDAFEEGAQAQAPARAATPPALSWWSAFRPQPLPLAFAALLVAAGVGGGWLLRGARATPLAPASSEAQQIAELRDQVRSTQQLAVLSLLQEQSASDRLQGVSWSTRLQGPDSQVVDALVHSLDYDSSPDVRLAALDALQRAASGPENGAAGAIQRQLVAAFPRQKSPLVQIALVDSFVELRDAQSRALLQQVRNDASYNEEVRQRAAWGLAQPTWN